MVVGRGRSGRSRTPWARDLLCSAGTHQETAAKTAMKIASVMTRDPRTLAVAAGVLANVNFLARKAAAKKWNWFSRGPDLDEDGEAAGIAFCYEDDEVDHVKQDMVRQCAHRLPVIDRRRRLVGIVSIDDVRAFSYSM